MNCAGSCAHRRACPKDPSGGFGKKQNPPTGGLTSTARWLELADTALQNPKLREQKKWVPAKEQGKSISSEIAKFKT
jgi:hypothetical protein